MSICCAWVRLMTTASRALSAFAAFHFVWTMGIVNLFAHMAYEGGGSINGAIPWFPRRQCRGHQHRRGAWRITGLCATPYGWLHQRQDRQSVAADVARVPDQLVCCSGPGARWELAGREPALPNYWWLSTSPLSLA